MNITISNKLKSLGGGLVTPSEFSTLQKISEAFSNLTAKLWSSTSQAYQAIEAVSFAIDELDRGLISGLYIKIVLKIPGEKEKIEMPGAWQGNKGVVFFPSPFDRGLNDAVAPAPTLNEVPLAMINAIQKTLKQKLKLIERQTIAYSKIVTDMVGFILDEEANLVPKS